MTADAVVEQGARRIVAAFADYNAEFREITRRASARFEARDWHGNQQDAVERIELYDRWVDRTVAEMRRLLGERALDRALWRAIRDRYADDAVGKTFTEPLAMWRYALALGFWPLCSPAVPRAFARRPPPTRWLP